MTVLTLTPVSILYSIIIPIMIFYSLTKISSLNKIMATESSGKYIYLDPIRGIAALLVFIHHSMMVYNQHTIGKFDFYGVFSYESLLVKKAYFHFGQTSVMVFFMITGFLFFSKILSFDTPLNVKSFFLSRIKRLLPAMGSCFILYILVCYILRDQNNQVSFINYLVSWLSFGFISLPKVSDNFPGWSLTAGVFWTLVIEWKFYILIPFFSALIFGKRSAFLFLTSLCLLIFYLYKTKYYSNNPYINEKDASIYFCFMAGLAISLLNKYYSHYFQEWIKSPLTALICIAIYIFSFYYTYDSYNFPVAFSTCLILLAVIFGNSFFGVLKLKALHWAGKSSYSIYIMHALIMHLVFSFTSDTMGYYGSLFVAAITLCIITLLNYLFVEKRYMHNHQLTTSSLVKS